MSYTVEQVNGCTKKLIFNFETLDLTTEIKTAVAKKQKTVNLKGFRKGKAPLSMVEQLYGPQLETDALNQFIQTQLFEAITKEDLRVVGQPVFENMKYEQGSSVSFDAVIETFPQVELKAMDGLSFTRDKVEVTDEDIKQTLDNYLSSKAEMVEVTDKDTALDKGLFAVFNFEGVKEDGERPENMKGEEYLLEIGSGQFIPGFEDGMLGLKAGDKKNIDLTFPADYHAEDLQNAKVTFEVELLEIKEKRLPEFDDEVAKGFGFESVADFETKTRDNLEKQKTRAADEKLHQEILEKLIEENQFDIPNALLFQQKDHLKQDLVGTLKQQGFTDEMVDEYFSKWDGDMDTKAAFQVRSGVILDTLATQFEVETNDKDLDEKIEEMASTSGMDVAQVKGYYNSNEQIKKNLMFAIREEKTFDKIKEKVTIK